MISASMKEMLKGSSVIRAMFEEGRRLNAIYGEENVFDFSLGNPSVPPPAEIEKVINEVLREESPTVLHGYMSNMGYESARSAIASALNNEFGENFTEAGIIMTVGAAGALNTVFKTILDPGDEVIVFAPFFTEYKNYVANYCGRIIISLPDPVTLAPDLKAFETLFTERTKAVIINSPNNPTGVIYDENTIKGICGILYAKQRQYGHEIYLVSDEPYRQLVYSDAKPPFLTKYYDNTFVAYSFSKTLSLPGERIGYLAVPGRMSGFEEIMGGLTVANRILGFVNAPSLFQKVVARCINMCCDISTYRRNRDVLYSELTRLGFECVKPEGAFYMYPKSPDADDARFCGTAKKYNILLVPGSAFGYGGHFRLAYCTSREKVEKSIAAFEKLAEDVFGRK
ncbi:MAG: pyridoxal phosphate-dependent aminotransferase [Clostridiales bacterium]|nr:pyridoxal phosphate-dependent aminotransferase [Clostridiales bacterium]